MKPYKNILVILAVFIIFTTCFMFYELTTNSTMVSDYFNEPLQPVVLTLPFRLRMHANMDVNKTLIELCHYDYTIHSHNPAATPMVSQLLDTCLDRETVSLTELNSRLALSTVPVIQPSGFIFHSARCGSTLIANVLAADDKYLVLAEPPLPVMIYRMCRKHHCSTQFRRLLIESVIKVMGSSPYHDEFFVKFQSASSLYIQDLRAIYPQVRTVPSPSSLSLSHTHTQHLHPRLTNAIYNIALKHIYRNHPKHLF